MGSVPRGAAQIRARAGAGRMGRPHPAARGSHRGERSRAPHRGGGALVTLAETQRLFWEALRGEAASTSFVAGPDRLHVYADMFLWRQVDALRSDFPQLAAKLGDDAFFVLAERYILAHPSEDPDRGRLGRHFAQFCGDELAALDWARSEVYLEAEVQRMEPAEFA